MSEKYRVRPYGESQDDFRRQEAVEAALYLIEAQVSGEGANTGSLDHEMNKLSEYAERIERALKRS